jgi:hypothetical protein
MTYPTLSSYPQACRATPNNCQPCHGTPPPTPVAPPQPVTPANHRCFAYGPGIWGGDPNKWIHNSAFTTEVPAPFFPAALTLIGGYLQPVGAPAQPLTLPAPASLILSGPAYLVDKGIGIGLGLLALDQLINSLPEFAAYGITFHAGRNPYWAIDYNTTVIADLGLVFTDSSNNGLRSTAYVLRTGAAGYGDAFISTATTPAQAQDPATLIYSFADTLYVSETPCIAL